MEYNRHLTAVNLLSQPSLSNKEKTWLTGKFPLLGWLVIAALADWLITRGLARMAMFMPKSPPVLAVYRGLVFLGQYASVMCSLLGVVVLGWLAWRLWSSRKVGPGLGLACLSLLNLRLIVAAPDVRLVFIAQLLLLGTIAWFGWNIWNTTQRVDRQVAVLLPVLAVWVGSFTHAWQALYAVLHWPGPPPYLLFLFNLGELLAVLSPIGLWWVFALLQPNKGGLLYAVALMPAIAFLAAHWLNPSMTAILAIWSTGLTLSFPAPLYAASLWLWGVTILVSLKQNSPPGFALVLLAAAGYAPQLSSQIILSLVGLSLLANSCNGDFSR